MQLRLEDEDAALEEQEGKGKLQLNLCLSEWQFSVTTEGILHTHRGQIWADSHH